MLAQASIRSATSTEVASCIHTLTRAFETDPVCCWAWPGKQRYWDAFPAFCSAFGGAAFDAGTAHLGPEASGVALWLPPGTAPHEETLVALIRETVPEPLQEAMFSIFEQMGAYHPRETHWHLPLIGVDPGHQGQGIGSALLRHALAECDRSQVLAYLEGTSPANVRLYERHGFEPLGRIQAADSPPIIPMARRPRPVD